MKIKKKKQTIVQRRLAVLKDALKQVEKKNYIPEEGILCRIYNLSDLDWDTQLKGILTKKFLSNKNCIVCQRGALLLSLIRKENSFTVGDVRRTSASFFDPNSIVDRRLLDLFTGKQIALMEAAFEVSGAIRYNQSNPLKIEMISTFCASPSQLAGHLNKEELFKAINFGVKYQNMNERQIAILSNAIKNKGEFTP